MSRVETKLQLFEPLVASSLDNWDYTNFDERLLLQNRPQVYAGYIY